MKIDETIAGIDKQIERLTKQRNGLLAIKDRLPDIDLNIASNPYIDYLDFNQPTRAQAVKIMTAMKAGKWAKVIASEGKVHYENKTLVPGLTLRMYAAEAPANCKIVYDEVEIPAQPARTQKVARLVCRETHVVGV